MVPLYFITKMVCQCRFFAKNRFLGDTIMLPSTEVHYDDEIYEDPKSFKWDRFLNKAKFTKGGKNVTKNEMAFGGGKELVKRTRLILKRWVLVPRSSFCP